MDVFGNIFDSNSVVNVPVGIEAAWRGQVAEQEEIRLKRCN
jgi:hypothetical protein